MTGSEDLLASARRWREMAANREAANWRELYLLLATAYEQAAQPQPPLERQPQC
jgi:hypothetical protein